MNLLLKKTPYTLSPDTEPGPLRKQMSANRLEILRPSRHSILGDLACWVAVAQGINSKIRRASTSEPKADDYDGFGILRPVVSRRTGAPPYALVHERGDVRWFISPSPGLNLQSMLGRKIGVTGTRGYMPEYGRLHVMVRRFRSLEETAVKPIRR